MSWLYSRALVVAYWEGSCSDGGQSAPLNTNPMPRAFCSPDRMTDFCRLSRFGMTFAPLTGDLGEGLLTWCLEGSRAKTSARQDKGRGSQESAVVSGWKWRESSVKYDPAMRSWKTRQCSLLGDSEWFSETWPRWGLMRDGECWELPMSERPTFERGSGLLQTLVADDAVQRAEGKWNSRGEPKLSAQVRMMPTLRKTDGERGGRGDLIQAVRGNPNSHYKLAPTLTRKGNYNRKGASRKSADGLATVIGGNLNPTWCEWFMGFLLQWTELAC